MLQSLVTAPFKAQTSLRIFRRAIGSISKGQNSVKIQWKSIPNNPETEFHYVWLRDNCPCTECYSPANNQKLVHPLALSSTIQPVAVSHANQSLVIDWPDGHRSDFSADFLKHFTYDGSIETPHDGRIPHNRDSMQTPVLWDKNITADLPKVCYQSIMESDEDFLKWNSLMETYGFCLVQETPFDLESMQRLYNRIGLVRNTFWGDYYVLGKGANSTGADKGYSDPTYLNTSVPIPHHTDGSYLLAETPALQLFQLLSFNGKELPFNILTDGFKIAEMIRHQSEYHFQLLARVPIPFQYEDNDRLHYASYCTFDVEPYTGRLVGVRYCNARRMITSSYCQHKLKEFDSKATMADFYEAMHMFNRALYSEDLGCRFQIELGTALFTYNHRVLHSRTAHDGERVLRGGYINHQDWRGRVMATRKRLSLEQKL